MRNIYKSLRKSGVVGLYVDYIDEEEGLIIYSNMSKSNMELYFTLEFGIVTVLSVYSGQVEWEHVFNLNNYGETYEYLIDLMLE